MSIFLLWLESLAAALLTTSLATAICANWEKRWLRVAGPVVVELTILVTASLVYAALLAITSMAQVSSWFIIASASWVYIFLLGAVAIRAYGRRTIGHSLLPQKLPYGYLERLYGRSLAAFIPFGILLLLLFDKSNWPYSGLTTAVLLGVTMAALMIHLTVNAKGVNIHVQTPSWPRLWARRTLVIAGTLALLLFFLTIKVGLSKINNADITPTPAIEILFLAPLIVYMVLLIFGLLFPRKDMSTNQAALRWPRRKLANALGVFILLFVSTFSMVDYAQKERMAKLVKENKAKLLRMLPTNIPDEQNAFLAYQKVKFASDDDEEWINDSFWADKAMSEWDDFLKRNKQALASIRQAASLPGYINPRTYDYATGDFTGFLSVMPTRSIASALGQEARSRSLNGDMKGALESLSVIRSHARQARQSPRLVPALISVVFQSIRHKALQKVLIEGSPIKPGDVELPVAAPNQYLPAVHRAIYFDRMITLNSLLSIPPSGHVVENREMAKDLGYGPGMLWFVPVWAIRPFDACYRVFFLDHDLEAYNLIREPLKDVSFVQDDATSFYEIIVFWLSGNDVSWRYSGSYAERAQMAEARDALDALALASEAYRAEKNRYPAKLEDLLPRYIEAIPADPYGGGAMKMSHGQGGVTIYSVGPDEVDQLGEYEYGSGKRDANPGDIVFRLGPTAKLAGLNDKLMSAARSGDLAGAKKLLASGAQINHTDSIGWSPLLSAAFLGHGDLALYLIYNGADEKVVGDGQLNLLMAATAGGLTDIVKKQLASGADVNSRGWGGSKMILADYSDSFISVSFGYTPLILASGDGAAWIDASRMKMVSSRKALKNGLYYLEGERRASSISPENRLAKKRMVEKMSRLQAEAYFKINAYVDLKRAYKKIKKDVETIDSDQVVLVSLLIKSGADINARTFHGWTAVMSAHASKNSDVERLLLDFGANYFLQDRVKSEKRLTKPQSWLTKNKKKKKRK